MSTPADQYRDYVEQNSQAFQTAVESWTKTVEQTVSAAPTNPAQVDPQQVVNQVFDFAEQMLAMQREFATGLLNNSLNLANRASSQAADRAANQVPEG